MPSPSKPKSRQQVAAGAIHAAMGHDAELMADEFLDALAATLTKHPEFAKALSAEYKALDTCGWSKTAR